MMEKTKAWQTWIPAWVAVLIVVIGWAFTIVYQAKGHVDEIQNLIQAYQKLDTRLDVTNQKMDAIGTKVDTLSGYVKGLQERRMAADPPKKK